MTPPCPQCGEADCVGPCAECGSYADCAGEPHDEDCVTGCGDVLDDYEADGEEPPA